MIIRQFKKNIWATAGIGFIALSPLLTCWKMYQDYIKAYKCAAAQKPTGQEDAIVVLTGCPGRIAHGLQRRQAGQMVFISGTHPSFDKRTFCKRENIRPGDLSGIYYSARAQTTGGNALDTEIFLKEHPEIRSLCIVTSANHGPRAALEMKQVLKHHKLSYSFVGQPGIFDKEVLYYALRRYCGVKSRRRKSLCPGPTRQFKP